MSLMGLPVSTDERDLLAAPRLTIVVGCLSILASLVVAGVWSVAAIVQWIGHLGGVGPR